MTDYKNLKLIASSSPHIRSNENTRSIMLDVIIAMLPALVWAIYNFGFKALISVAVSVVACLFWEWLYRKLLKKPQAIGDLSAVVTGMLLAFVCPPELPWWTLVIGAFFSIVVVKQLYGGIGCNFLNPALAGRAILLASYATAMTTWTLPTSKVDTVVSTATPLAIMKEGTVEKFTELTANYSVADMFIGRVGGSLGEVSALALLLGGALPDCSGWMDYCRKAPLDDAYCYEQPRARMDSMCAHFPLDPRSLTDPRVKAIAAVGPVFGMLFSSQGLAGLHPHLLLVSLEHDDLSIPSLHADALYERMGRKPAHLFLDKADMSLLMAPCPPSLANELPEMCHDELDPLRQQLFSTLTRRLAAFFLEWLGTQEATEGFFSLGTGE